MDSLPMLCISPPPPIWLWVGVVVGIIALLAAIMIPTIFIFWQKPKIGVSFEDARGYRISLWIKSVPPPRFLAKIGVDRRIINVDCAATIWDMNGNMIEFTPYPIASSKDLRIHVAELRDRIAGNPVFLKDQMNEYSRKIDVGLYIFELEIWDTKDSIQIKRTKKNFRVNSIAPFV
jgi:hypothetical protein